MPDYMMSDCPCGSAKKYSECCGRFISGHQHPSTPEELMRSRYTAHTQANIDYIIHTMKSPAADGFDAKTAKEWAEQTKWIKLEVIHSSVSGTQGIVEFRAYFSLFDKTTVLHEISEFHQEQGRWYYIDGTTPEKEPPVISHKIGRNDACSCGSGRSIKNVAYNHPFYTFALRTIA